MRVQNRIERNWNSRQVVWRSAVICSLLVAAAVAPSQAWALKQEPSIDFSKPGFSYNLPRTCNLELRHWLTKGGRSLEQRLEALADPAANAELVKDFQRATGEDAEMLESSEYVLPILVFAAEQAESRIKTLEERAHTARDVERKAAEDTLRDARAELVLLRRAPAVVRTWLVAVQELHRTAQVWAKLWSAAEGVQDPGKTRKEVARQAGEARTRLQILIRKGLLDELSSRAFAIGDDCPPALRSELAALLDELPRLAGPITIESGSWCPLVPPAAGQVQLVFRTTAPAEIRARISGSGAPTETLTPSRRSSNEYAVIIHTGRLNKLAARQVAHHALKTIATWRLTYELLPVADAQLDLPVQAGTNLIIADASAPAGRQLLPAPEKRGLLRQYASTNAIPLQPRHHIGAIIGYSLFGWPRDMVDSVFGVVDKVPYVSIPVNFVYAGPGQLLFKPWWRTNYTSYADQSAGFLSPKEWQAGGTWEFFENARTWPWPPNQQSDQNLFALLFYVGLGLPRDLVDMPFGWVDQIPYVSIPVSYLYQPLTLVTKPWYCRQYTIGVRRGVERVPYRRQSKSVIGLSEWWGQSRWVFFENFRTARFRSPAIDKQSRERAEYRQQEESFRRACADVEKRNAEVRNSAKLELRIAPATAAGN